MAYNFSPFKKQIDEIKEWLVSEFGLLRTGRATPTLLDNIMVESYGTRTPIKHVANITIEGPKSLKISPWDNKQVKDIETAIAAANIGVSTAPDSSGVRVIFPDLTEERRKLLVKMVGEKMEDGRVSIRKEREKVMDELSAGKKEGSISEDEFAKAKEDLQKIVDEANASLKAMAEKKEAEVMEI
jgi:ribosome recycling factor